jgi:hypothetical protein
VLLVPVKDEEQLARDREASAGKLAFGARANAASLAREHTLLKIVASIRRAGLETCAYKSAKYDSVVVKVRDPRGIRAPDHSGGTPGILQNSRSAVKSNSFPAVSWDRPVLGSP